MNYGYWYARGITASAGFWDTRERDDICRNHPCTGLCKKARLVRGLQAQNYTLVIKSMITHKSVKRLPRHTPYQYTQIHLNSIITIITSPSSSLSHFHSHPSPSPYPPISLSSHLPSPILTPLPPHPYISLYSLQIDKVFISLHYHTTSPTSAQKTTVALHELCVRRLLFPSPSSVR